MKLFLEPLLQGGEGENGRQCVSDVQKLQSCSNTAFVLATGNRDLHTTLRPASSVGGEFKLVDGQPPVIA